MNTPSRFASPPACQCAHPAHVTLLSTLLPVCLVLAQTTPPKDAQPEPDCMLASPAQALTAGALPQLSSEHVTVSDVRSQGGANQHVHLAYFLNRYWLMWSDGPGVENRVGQRVKFASSENGLSWTLPAFLTPEPPVSGPSSPHYNTHSLQGFRWMACGFWPRRGELFALVSLDEAGEVRGPSLQTRAFRLDPKTEEWQEAGVACTGGITTQPPQQLSGGAWLMSQQTHDQTATAAQFLLGGQDAIDRWKTIHVPPNRELAPEAPFWWALPNGDLAALFQDRRHGCFYRAHSLDQGLTWSQPIRTNFPAASPEFHGTRLSDGRYVLISASAPSDQGALALSISPDGLVFHPMFSLPGKRRPMHTPAVLEAQGQVLVAFSGDKQSVEVLRFPLAALQPGPNIVPK